MSYANKAKEILSKMDEGRREMVLLGFFPKPLMEDAADAGYDRNELGFKMMELEEAA